MALNYCIYGTKHLLINSNRILENTLRNNYLYRNLSTTGSNRKINQDYNIPNNINATETQRFSPQRTRDITSKIISMDTVSGNSKSYDVTSNNNSTGGPHINSYDCTGTVSLNATMQSNVPTPFSGTNDYNHLSIPGGQWEQGNKHLSDTLHTSHYRNLKRDNNNTVAQQQQQQQHGNKGKKTLNSFGFLSNWQHDHNNTTISSISSSNLLDINCAINKINCLSINKRFWHGTAIQQLQNKTENLKVTSINSDKDTNKRSDTVLSSNSTNDSNQPLSRTDKLKKAVKEYGSTVIIFHIGISLISLGGFYLLVSSGLDVVAIIQKLGWESTALTKITANASTFVVAYAVHKVFAPVRISITLASTPFIVRYLRIKGILKPPSSPPSV